MFKKLSFLFAILFIAFSACKDTEKNDGEELEDYRPTEVQKSSGMNVEDIESSDTDTSDGKADPDSEATNSININSGTYIKESASAANDCNVLDIDLSASKEICLVEGEIYANVRYQKDGEKINVFYDSVSSKTSRKDIPWNKFDQNKPIAVITSSGNNQISLDWQGFSINQETAVDYALLGKKNLEATYNKN